MTTQAYLIQCITNLHVGSGDASYGIVDKLVQRDTIFNYPTIHASSLKGSLREHFESVWGKTDQKTNLIFGKKTNNDNDTESGNLNFLNADLVALPVRCSHRQFALTFCPQNVEFVNEKAKMILDKELLKLPTETDKLFTKEEGLVDRIFLEDDDLQRVDYSTPFSDTVDINFTAFDQQYALVSDDKFRNYAENLPVIARNRLDEDKNLWYEEVVPHQTIFITYMVPKQGLLDDATFSEFEKELLEEPIQIGANSSVGYGLCKFHKIKFKNTKS